MWGARRDKEIEGAVMGRSAGPGVLLGPGEATEVILDGIKYLARGCIIKDPCITVAIIFTTNKKYLNFFPERQIYTENTNHLNFKYTFL